MSVSEECEWIHWFCKQRGHEFFCEVDEEYIQDKFNLNFLDSNVTNYQRALEVILDLDAGSGSDAPTEADVEQCAEKLYGLIHARFILTNRGIDLMLEKYRKGDFGFCPRVFCLRQPVLPIGLSDNPEEDMVRIFCPKCNDVYLPRSSRHAAIDGAFFGTGFPHMLFMVKPEVRPKRTKTKFVPRLYGFKIHQIAYRPNTEVVSTLKEAPQAPTTSASMSKTKHNETPDKRSGNLQSSSSSSSKSSSRSSSSANTLINSTLEQSNVVTLKEVTLLATTTTAPSLAHRIGIETTETNSTA